MKTIKLMAILPVAFLLTIRAGATTFYVDASNTAPVAPYTNWPTASADIQNAIDVSTDGDLILVTNGLYNTGGRVVYGSLTNRVVINKAVTVQSVNGPGATIIQGNPVIGDRAVRCVYLTNYAVISGFTLTNGATLNTGDAYQEEGGGGLYCCSNSIATNCILVGNSSNSYGGGAVGGSTFTTVFGTLAGCSLIQNTSYWGGAVLGVKVTGSLLMSNLATSYGGGAYNAVLTNCIIMQNVAGNIGGGAYSGSLYGCLVISNYSMMDGGASLNGGSAINCTILANNAYQGAGGIHDGGNTVNNCIIYYNTVTTGSFSNYAGGTSFQNCCTMPKPSGIMYRNITNEPGFVGYADGNYRLQSNSPCINAGQTTSVRFSSDLDGNPRIVDSRVDIGAYECQTANSHLPAYWLQQYGLSTDSSIDSDGDRMNNWQEFISGSNPTNATSYLHILEIRNNVSGPIIFCDTGTGPLGNGGAYYFQRSTNVARQAAFSTIVSNRNSIGGMVNIQDITATNGGPYFCRVGVQ